MIRSLAFVSRNARRGRAVEHRPLRSKSHATARAWTLLAGRTAVDIQTGWQLRQAARPRKTSRKTATRSASRKIKDKRDVRRR